MPTPQRCPPLVLGWDATGEIDAVGAGAAHRVGQRVAALSPWFDRGAGTFAEVVVLDPGVGRPAARRRGPDWGGHGAVERAHRPTGAGPDRSGARAAAAGDRGERSVRVAKVSVRPDSRQLAELLADLAAGRLTTAVAQQLPLAEAGKALELAAGGGLRGKVVLVADLR